MIIQPEQAGCLKTAVSVAVIHDRSLNIWSGDDGNSAAADYDIILFSFGLLSCRVHVHGAFLRDFWQSRDLCAEVCVCVGNVSPFSPSSYKRIIFSQSERSQSETDVSSLCYYFTCGTTHTSTVTRSASYNWSMERLSTL